MTTNETVTEAQIETLRTEAAEAGDAAQVQLCERALRSFTSLGRNDMVASIARAKCVRAINAAEAMS